MSIRKLVPLDIFSIDDATKSVSTAPFIIHLIRPKKLLITNFSKGYIFQNFPRRDCSKQPNIKTICKFQNLFFIGFPLCFFYFHYRAKARPRHTSVPLRTTFRPKVRFRNSSTRFIRTSLLLASL